MKRKSAGTLKAILRHYLAHEYIDIIQCIESQYTIPEWQRNKLGETNISLDSSFLIGESIISKNNKFRILLKKVTAQDLIDYSILGNKMTEIDDLIKFSLNEILEHEVCLEISKDEKIPFFLEKDNNSYLGINMWIGNSTEDEQIIMTKRK